MKLFLILTVILSINISFAQNPTIKWGKELKTSANTSVKNVCFTEKDVFLIRKKGKRIFSKEKWIIDKLDKESLNMVQTKEHTVLFSDPKVKVGLILEFNKQLIVSGFKSANDKKELLVKRIGDDLIPEQKTLSVDTIAEDEYITHDVLSAKNIPLMHTCVVGFKSAKLYLKVKQIDSALSLIKSSVFNFDIPYKNSEIVTIKLADENLVYVLIKHSPRGGGVFEYDVFKYSLMACDMQSGQFKEFEIELPDKNITDISIMPTTGKSLMVSGFYSNKKNTRDDVAGVFYLNISNLNLGIIGKGVKDLPDDLMRNFLSERKLKKGKELSGFTINYIIPNSDGGTIILSEQSYYNQICNTDFRTGMVYCNDYYHYNDIIAIRINAGGDIEWTSKIGKQQVSINDNGYYSSYFPFVIKNGLYLIYNDNAKNIGLLPQNPSSVGNFRKAVPVRVLVENSGKVNRVDLLSPQKQLVILRPKVYFQENAYQGIILGKKNGNDVLGKIFIEGN